MKKRKKRQLVSWLLVMMIVLNVFFPFHSAYAQEVEKSNEGISSENTGTPSNATRVTVDSEEASTEPTEEASTEPTEEASIESSTDTSMASPSDATQDTATTAKPPSNVNNLDFEVSRVRLLAATPSNASLPPVMLSSEDSVNVLENVQATVKQNGSIIEKDKSLTSKDPVSVQVSFGVPVEGDYPTPPTTIKKGDTATFELSRAFQLISGTSIPLKQDDILVGHVSFTTDSKTKSVFAKILFDGADEIFDGTYNTVKCQFSAKLQYDTSGDAGSTGDHTGIILDKSYTVTVPPVEIIYDVKKSGTLDLENKNIEWKVEIQATQAGQTIDLEGYRFSDDLTDVGEYIDGSMKIETDAINPLVDGKCIRYVFPEDSKGPKTITFKTRIEDDIYYAPSGVQTIRNKALLLDKDDTIKEEGQSSVSWTPKWIEKSGESSDQGGTGIYDPQNRTITWTIISNHNGAALQDVVITDILSADITDEAKKLQFDSATLQKWNGTGWNSANPITPDINGQYAIGDINSKILLKIVTKVPDDPITTGVTTYNNTASIKWKDLAGPGVNTRKVGVHVGYNAIRKTGAADTSTGEITWTVTVDPKGQTIADPKVYDLLVYGNSTSGFNSSKVSGIPVGVNPTSLKARYGQKYIDNSFLGTGLNLIVYPIEQDGKRVADLVEISGFSTNSSTFTIKSQVLDPEIFATNKTTHVINTASLFSSNVKLNEATAYVNYHSKMLFKEMLKCDAAANPMVGVNERTIDPTKGFDYQNKFVIFRLSINANNMDLTNMKNEADEALGTATITDALPEGWEFDKIDGLDYLIFEGTANSDGSVQAKDAALPTVSGLTSSFNASTASFTFTQLDKPYVILVKARPVSEKVSEYFSLNKTSTVRNNLKMKTEKTSEVTSFQDVSIVSRILSKTYEIPKAGELLWKVEYKPYDIPKPCKNLMDTLPVGIDLRTDDKGTLLLNDGNITVNEMTLNVNGTYTLGDEVKLKLGENISYDHESRVLNFTIPDSKKAYRFSYITDITGDPGKISNKVSLYSEDFNHVETSKNYAITKADGRATLKKNGWIVITKTDVNGVHLAGAEFTLFASDGQTVIRKGITGSDGTLKFKVIPDGEYVLRETVPPAGYILEGTDHTLSVKTTGGTVISSIDGKTGKDANTITVKNVQSNTVGNLTISKIVAGNASDTTKKFNFTLTLSDVSGIYSYRGNGVSNGTVKSGDTISLTHGQSITVLGLPKDTAYAVKEEDYTSSGYVSVSTGASGTIIADTVQYASFTNTKVLTPNVEKLTGNLIISKSVTGRGADIKRKFDFVLTLDGTSDTYPYSGNGIPDGIIKNGDKISLAHGQSITITGLPNGITYRVKESDYSAEKYSVASVGDSGIIEANATKVAAFTNTKQRKSHTSSDSGNGKNVFIDESVPKTVKNVEKKETPVQKIKETLINITTDIPKGAMNGSKSGLPKTGDNKNWEKELGELLIFSAILGILSCVGIVRKKVF